MKKTDNDLQDKNLSSDNLDSLSAGELKKINRELRKKSAYLENKVLYLETLYELITGEGEKNK